MHSLGHATRTRLTKPHRHAHAQHTYQGIIVQYRGIKLYNTVIIEVVDTDSEDNAVNPDSEAEMLFSGGEAEEEPGQSTHNKASTSTAASSIAPAKKKESTQESFCYNCVSTVFKGN